MNGDRLRLRRGQSETLWLFAFEVGETLQSAFIKKAEKVALTQVIVITGALPQMADKLIEVPPV